MLRSSAEPSQLDDYSHFRKVFEQAPVGLAYRGLDGRWLHVNQALCDITGYSSAELLQRTFHQITHPDDIASDLQYMQGLLENCDTRYTWEKRYIHKSGDIVWVKMTCCLVRDKKEEPEYFVAVIEDISVQRAALEALRLSEERFHAALKNSPIMVYHQDRELRYTWVHNATLGVRQDQMIGAQDAQLFPDHADTHRIQSLKREVLNSGVGVRTEIQIDCEGTQRSFDLTIEPLHDTDGNIAGITCAAVDITDRVRSEAQVQYANQRLSLAIEALGGFTYESDLRTGSMECSSGISKLLGHQLADVPTTMAWWQEQIHPDDRQRVSIEALTSRESSGRRSVEYRVRHQEGYYVTVWDHALTIFDDASRPIRLFGTTIDVSARSRAEERQRFLTEATTLLSGSIEYEARLAKLARLATSQMADWCVINMLNEDGSIQAVAMSHADPAKVQWALESIRKRPLNPNAATGTPRVIRTGRAEFYPDVTDEILQQTSESREDLELLRSFGSRSVMIVPIWRQGRTLGAISFMSTDSSRRYTTDDLAMVEELATRTAIAIENARLYAAQRRARADAERAAKRAALLAEAGALLAASLDYEETLNQLAHFMVSRFGDLCVVFLSGGDGAIWRVAAAHIDPVREDALRALQVHPIEPDSAHPAAVVIRTGKSTFNPSLTGAIEALAQNNPDAIERARTLIPTSHLIVPLIARRRVIGALSFGTISAENSYDIADLLVAEELGNRAALAIDNSRLYHDMQQAVRTRDVFLSIASHELKTPLTALFGQAQLLQRRIMHAPESSERDHRAIRVIVEQAQRLNKLIMTLLDVSRLSQGQLGLERVPIDLGILVQRVSEDFEPELEQHRLVFEPYHEPLIVTGDWLRLEQVMQNLLQNAVKYSPKGGRIVIRLDRRGTRVLLSVADEGIGIPQTEITRLFERFYRVETDAAQHVSGIGVGLYIVKEIVTAHDGEVHVTSTEGVGSTFTVSLPHASV